MLPEVLSKTSRAERLLGQAEPRVMSAVLAANSGATQRGMNKALTQCRTALTQALADGKPHVVNAIKLAYVRGGRSVDQQFHLDDPDELQVNVMAGHALMQLERAARDAHRNVRAVYRRLNMAAVVDNGPDNEMKVVATNVLRSRPVTVVVDSRGRRWGLEQYAHALLTNVTERAYQQGALAARGHVSHSM